MKTREAVIKDAKELLEVITTYKVLKLEQLYAAIRGKEHAVKQSIIRLLDRENRIFIHEDIVSVRENWSKDFDRDIITAFWILLDFWDDIIFNTSAAFPAKIEFITSDDAYDIIVAQKGQEHILNTFFSRRQDDTIKHLVVVEDEEQMCKLRFPGIAVFCIVNEDGNISYYQEQEGD